MMAIKTRFDGEKIVLPAELLGAPPGDVIIVVERPVADADSPRPSVFDVIGRAPRQRSAEDIDAQIAREREEWDER
jgi:hypothetical protein